MHHLIALFAGCLLHAPADDPCKEARAAQYEFLHTHGAEVEWNANGTVKHMKATGLFLRSGIASLDADLPVPQVLDAIGPALLARGTEELRIRFASRDRTAGTIDLKLEQLIGGHEVKWSYVNIVLHEATNEVREIWAGFMPDRGLDHEPRLSADEARAKAGTELRESIRLQFGVEDAQAYFYDGPAYLAYEFEQAGADAILGGALVWIVGVHIEPELGGPVSVDAATGKIIRMYDTHF